MKELNMSDVDSSDEEKAFQTEGLKETQVNGEKPHVVDFLPSSMVPLEDNQEVDERNSLQKIKEENLDQEISPLPKVMLESCENGILDHVVQILDKDPSLINCTDEDGYSPLHRASYNGHLDVVRVLLERGADVRAITEDGWQPLHCACRWGEYLEYAVSCMNYRRQIFLQLAKEC